MKLDRLPDGWVDEIKSGAGSIDAPYSGIKRDAVLDTLNALLASGKARIENEVSVNVWRGTELETGRRRLIIELD